MVLHGYGTKNSTTNHVSEIITDYATPISGIISAGILMLISQGQANDEIINLCIQTVWISLTVFKYARIFGLSGAQCPFFHTETHC